MLFDVSYQTLSDDENKRAFNFFSERNFNAVYKALEYELSTGEQVGTRKSYQIIFNGSIRELTQLGLEFFKVVYQFEDKFPYEIIQDDLSPKAQE